MNRNTLDRKEARKDAKELLKMIENLPEEKKREIFGIVRGYVLCIETGFKKTA